MEQPRNGAGGKVVAFEQVATGRRRNGSVSTYLDVGWDADAGRSGRPLPPQGMGSRRRTFADGELDVFAAERYFKGAIDGDGDRKEGVAATAVGASVETAAARPVVAVARPLGSRASTPSMSASSAASANSQTGLLRGRPHRRSRDSKCCVQVSVLMRACSGKRSVRVDDGAGKEDPRTGEAAASKIDWYRELRMQKASLGLAVAVDGRSQGMVAAGLPANLNLGAAKVAAIEREVVDKAAEFTTSTSRRRSFTLVAPVRANAPASGGVASGEGKGSGHDDGDDDGAGSESSSELFEIKSLMIDDCPYEPSEASIQWSVVTASATDASERGDHRVSARWVSGAGDRRGPALAVAGTGKQHRDRPPGGLLAGCVSHAAVDVSAATNRPATVAMMRRRG